MHSTLKRELLYFPAIIILFSGIYSCANMAAPTGGPKDETPPVFVRSIPPQGALNYQKNKIEIYFDENILLEKPGEKIVTSPPQKNMPTIKASGKKITVELNDTLQSNTTYTIDFSDAIADNNEKNPYPNFSFSFSTGEFIDSLMVSGLLLNARNLDPIGNYMVGLHKNLSDTAFVSEPFYRISRSDAYGKFSVKNLSSGEYRTYALNDLNRDYRFTAGEEIAFADSLIIPRFDICLKNDTIWKDSITIDSIRIKEYNCFLPDNILLYAFKENTTKNQFLQKQERLVPNKFSLYFNSPSEELPELTPLNFQSSDWYVLEKNATNDTLHYWIRDPNAYQTDTLVLQINYLKTDTAKNLVPFVDTLNIAQRITKNVQNQKKKKVEEEIKEPETVFFKPNVRLSGTLDLNMPISMEWESPVESYDIAGIRLEIKSDTLWKPVVGYTFEPDTSVNIRSYKLKTKWAPNTEYRFQIDSASFTSIYGTYNNRYSGTFKTKRLEDYGFIYFNLTNVDMPAFVELLNNSDNVLRTSPVKDNIAEFLFLTPGKYYARIFLDVNNNGIWDTGDFRKQIQPEPVYYYDKEIQLPANFEIEQDWDIKALPVDKQKPKELIKNRPKDKTKPEL